jgi:hypothetical protein
MAIFSQRPSGRFLKAQYFGKSSGLGALRSEGFIALGDVRRGVNSSRLERGQALKMGSRQNVRSRTKRLRTG